jgi:hypothetical protein
MKRRSHAQPQKAVFAKSKCFAEMEVEKSLTATKAVAKASFTTQINGSLVGMSVAFASPAACCTGDIGAGLVMHTQSVLPHSFFGSFLCSLCFLLILHFFLLLPVSRVMLRGAAHFLPWRTTSPTGCRYSSAWKMSNPDTICTCMALPSPWKLRT